MTIDKSKNQTTSRSSLDLNTVFLSVEVSRSSWVVGIHCPATDENIGTHKLEPNDVAGIIGLAYKARSRTVSDAPVLLCYEAGYEGFWLARCLEVQAPDIEVIIIDPASLEVDRRARKVKTDRIDATRMIRALKAWKSGDNDVLARVRVPTIKDEDRRRIGRERDALISERQRYCNRIRGLLALQGIFGLQPGKRDFPDCLVTTRTGYGGFMPPHALAEIRRIHARLDLVNRQFVEVETRRKEILAAGSEAEMGTVSAMTATLNRVHGIGINDATLMATEIFNRDFRNRRQLGSWAGLTSAPWSSGSIDHDQGITKAGPSRVRKHLIQMAWRWIRFQPESKLTQWFMERTGDGHGRNRKRMIVALARKLLVALWRLATQGVIPEGAIIK